MKNLENQVAQFAEICKDLRQLVQTKGSSSTIRTEERPKVKPRPQNMSSWIVNWKEYEITGELFDSDGDSPYFACRHRKTKEELMVKMFPISRG
jgi:hypothetical protein